jgi:hypothetical protein
MRIEVRSCALLAAIKGFVARVFISFVFGRLMKRSQTPRRCNSWLLAFDRSRFGTGRK